MCVTARLGVGVVVCKNSGGVRLGPESVCTATAPAVMERWPVIPGAVRVPLLQDKSANKSAVANAPIAVVYRLGMWRHRTMEHPAQESRTETQRRGFGKADLRHCGT